MQQKYMYFKCFIKKRIHETIIRKCLFSLFGTRTDRSGDSIAVWSEYKKTEVKFKRFSGEKTNEGGRIMRQMISCDSFMVETGNKNGFKAFMSVSRANSLQKYLREKPEAVDRAVLLQQEVN